MHAQGTQSVTRPAQDVVGLGGPSSLSVRLLDPRSNGEAMATGKPKEQGVQEGER